MTLEERIDREREALGLRPWEFAPSEVDDGPCPYSSPVVIEAWKRAQEWRRQMQEARGRKRAIRLSR